MSNSMRGAITFQAGGAERTLRFSTNAMVRYQDASGETLLAALQELQANPMDTRRLRAVFWAGLDGGSVEEAGDLMDDVGLPTVMELVSRAAEAAFPMPEGAGEGNAPKGRQKKAT